MISALTLVTEPWASKKTSRNQIRPGALRLAVCKNALSQRPRGPDEADYVTLIRIAHAADLALPYNHSAQSQTC